VLDGHDPATGTQASLVRATGPCWETAAGRAPRRRIRPQFDTFQKNKSCVHSHVGYVTKLSKNTATARFEFRHALRFAPKHG